MSKKTRRNKQYTVKRLIRVEKPVIDKMSVLRTVIMAAFMVAIAVYSWMTADEGQIWLWLSAGIIVAAILLNLFRIRYSTLLEMLLAALAPAVVFMLVESYTHLLSQMWEGPVFLNLVIYYLFFGFLLFVTGRTGRAIIIGSALLGIAGLANYFVILFRSSPILPWDLFSIGVAATVADNFEYELSVRACNVILLLIFIWVLCLKMKLRFKLSKFRGIGIVVMFAMMLTFGKVVQTDAAIAFFKMDTTLFTPTVLYRNNGLILSFVVNMRYLNIDEPAGYSEENLQKLQEELAGSATGNTESVDMEMAPNIIVVMNEAFSDLSVLGDYETNMEVMPFISSLTDNTQKGWMYSSVKGGNTANVEFEFLTGLSMYFLPVGSIPYQQYIRSEIPAISSQLSSIGYTSVGMHPYYPKGWNRNTVYADMGFDEMYFIHDFTGAEKLRTYVSDWTTYKKIIDRYENKDEDEKLFVFDVTMQNHGSYVKHFENFVPDVSILNQSVPYQASAEQYLSLIKRSDEAFKDLITYFESQEEPTIILMFGDHQPADYVTNVIDSGKTMGEGEYTTAVGKSGSDRKERYIVPYIMWANYDIEESTGEETSANYLGLRLLEAAGIPFTDFQTYLKELEKTVPILSASTVKVDPKNQEDAEKTKELLDAYYTLQYNTMFDGKNRLEGFFTYE